MSNYKDPNNVTRKLTKAELMRLENYDPEYKVDVQIAPCKNCPTRYLGCHNKCYKYQSFRQARDEYNEMIRKEREAASNDYLYDPYKSHHHFYASWYKRKK